MRKWIIIFFYLIFSIFNFCSIKCVFAATNFAKALQATNLYKSINLNDEISNIICIVEKTYFVKIISEHENYYKVEYNDITGFVKKNDVKEITNTPSTPYPYNIQLTIGSTCNLRSSPTINSNSNNVITTLEKGENNFTFIGKIFGEEAIDFGGTTWYYVKFNDQYGYIYNKYVNNISPIYENTENVEFKNDTPINNTNPITSTPTIIIIVLLFIPCFIILLILYLPRKIRTQKSNIIKEIYKY